MTLTRRSFLKSLGVVGAGAVVPWPEADGNVPVAGTAASESLDHWDGSPLGRILLNVMTVYNGPSWRSGATGKYYYWNDVVAVASAQPGVGLYGSNPTWLELAEGGFIYSSWVQPVADQSANAAVPVGEGGLWGMVTVPHTWARNGPGDSQRQREHMMYGTVHRITSVENDYYRVEEIYGGGYWLKAAHMRIVTPEEVSPISPDVPADQKRIEVSIGQQRLWAYEGDAVVFTTQVSTGTPETPTPHGEFEVFLKRHGQRMVGGQGEGFYNLPAIPYICYFTNSYAATHGTYWHNDYGRRHSNGCVNLLPEQAKWIFRWTTPAAHYFEFSTTATEENPGTKVVVGW